MQHPSTVLITEPDSSLQETLRQYLLSDPKYRYTILTAASGEMGLALCRDRQPDVVLLDLLLPDLDGLEFLERLQGQQQRGNMPTVIMLTEQDGETVSREQLHQIVRSIKLGAQDYLIKGQINRETLQTTVEKASAAFKLQRTRSQSQSLLNCTSVNQIAQSCELATADLRKSSALYQNIFDHSADCIKVLDLDGRLLSMNSAGVCLMQLGSVNEVLGKLWIEFWEEEYYDLIKAAMETALAGGTGRFYGYCYTAKGTPKYWDVRISAVFDELGNPQSFVVISCDVTKRKLSEDALQESHKQLVNTLESMTDAFFSLDTTWQFTFVNAQAGKVLQRTPTELIGKNVWEEFPEAVGLEFYQAYHRAMAEQVSVQFEAFYPPLDTWFEVRTYPSKSGLAVYFQDVNARKAAEAERERLLQQEQAARAQVEDLLQQLETERNRLEQILQKMPIGISISEAPSGKLLYHNEEAMRLLRHPLLASATFEDYAQYGGFHPDGKRYQPDDYPVAQSLLKGEFVKGFEMHYQRGDNTNTIFSVSSAPIFDPTGAMTAVVCAFEDIAPLKEASMRLRESEERLRLSLKASRMGIWDWDVQNDIVTWAGDNEKLFGLPLGSFAGTYEAFLNCVHPDDRLAVQQCVAAALTEKRGYNQEFRVVYPDGAVRWLMTQNELFLDDHGNPTRLIGTNQDITEAKGAQIAVRESERQYKLLANSIHQIIWVTDGNEEFQFANERWYDYCGMTFLEAAQNWESVVHPDDREDTRTKWETARRTGSNYIVEFRFRRADGEYRWHITHGIPVFDAQGQVEQWIATITDIHDRKLAEQRAEQAYAAEQHARSRAEAASLMKDEFLAIVSHELRSPLNAMLGWAKLLRSGKVQESMRSKALEVIERNAVAQTQLIEDLLDISRIIRGKVRIASAPVNLGQVIDAAIDTVQPSAEIKRIRLSSHLQTSAAIVAGDSARLTQVVWNLLSNAVKFTEEGGRVEVCLAIIGAVAQIRVIDTGKGISPDFLPYVFDRFRQAESATTRTTSGLGLGLAIVRSLVEMHCGTVRVESPGLGQGATFIVELPLLEVPQIGIDYENASFTLNDLSLEGVRVLVVDDEPDTREFLIAALEAFGATVTAAASASEGMQQLVQFKPTVLVSDIGMPNENGYAFIQKVRSLTKEQGGDIPAIALTAFARQEDKMQALAAGFQMHVAKPIEPTRLVTVVKTLATTSNVGLATQTAIK